MSGFIHPDRQRQHAREDAKQRFLDRKHGVDKCDTKQRDSDDSVQQPKWKTEDDRRRGSKWSQHTSGVREGWKKEEEREQEKADGDRAGGEVGKREGASGFVHPDRLQQVKPQYERGGGWQQGKVEPRPVSQHRLHASAQLSSPFPSPRPPTQPDERQWRRPPSPSRHDSNTGWDVTKVSEEKETSRSSPRSASLHPSSTSPARPPPDDDDPTAIDREWYDQDEENPVASDDAAHAFPTVDTSDSSTRRQARKLTARAQQVTRDNNAWEENRMFQSGVVTATTVDTDFTSAETEKKVQLVVHEMKPPFLDGRTVYTKQVSMVSVVKDSSSDMVMIARKGSALLASLREKAERNKMKDKFWEVAGNRIGDVMGVKAQESEEEKKEREKEEGEKQREGEGGGVDYRQASQFASHLQNKTAAQSEFSASNSVAAQRQYLPIYTCKDELMRVIRDNPVVIIVGETGSGKVSISPHSQTTSTLNAVHCSLA